MSVGCFTCMIMGIEESYVLTLLKKKIITINALKGG
jgi:hypothetical protein